MPERVLSQIAEFDIDKCQNVYGVSPCTAGRVESGTAQAGAASTLTLRAAASAVDDAYKNMTARLVSGAGSVQEQKISGYVGATKIATVEAPWRINMIPYSAQIDQWTGTAGVVTNTALDNDGAMKLDTITDDDAGNYESRNRDIVVPNDNATYLLDIWVLKDLAAPQQCGLNIGLNGGGAPVNITTRFALDGSNVSGCTMTDFGALYKVSFSITNNTTGNTALSFGVYPATAAAKGGGDNPAGTGSMTFGSVHLRKSTDPSDYIETGATAATLPDATSIYDVIDRPNACYNVFGGKSPCQDKPNYVKGVQTLKFTLTGSPIPVGQLVRPYIKQISRAPTRLDPEEGLAVRSSTTLTMLDEPGTDIECDPYVRDRATPAGGTYWTRFFARNQNYGGRQARIKQAFVDHGVFGATIIERFVIDSMKGPSGSGEVSITLKDLTKLLDKAKAPTPTSGKLAVVLGVNDLQLTLGAGDGAQYTSTGWVRVGKTIIRYDGKAGDVLTWPTSSYRAAFGTDAEEGKVGSVVQQCLVYNDVAFSDVIKDLYNRSGILDADMDLATLLNEDTTWLGVQYRVTALISDPESIATLAKELLKQAQAMAWWSSTEQKHKFKVFAPASPTAVVTKTLDETAYLREGSVDVERLDASRITLCAVYYALRGATENVKEAKNYLRADLTVDADAESANEYNDRLTQTIYSRWFGEPNQLAMRALSQRQVARYRDAPENIRKFSLDPKDSDVAEGQIVDLMVSGLVDAAGVKSTARVLITSRDDRGTHIDYSARVTSFDRRYGFIAPAGTANYPNNLGYACVSSAAGLMNDGTEGYLII